MSYWKRPQAPSHTTNTKKSLSKTTKTGETPKDSTKTKKDSVAVKLATKSDLRFISQLVQLCDIAVYSIGAYLHLYKLAKGIDTHKTFDLRDPQGPKQCNRIVGVLDDVVKAIERTLPKLRGTTLSFECHNIRAYQVLMAGVQQILQVVPEMKHHAKAVADAEADKKTARLPGQDVVARIGEVYEELVALKQGPVKGHLAPWDECVGAVESAFKHLS
jgi:hypothetical protein